MLHSLQSLVTGLPAPLAYVVVGALVLAEASLFVGFVVPGETAVLVGGILASTGHLSVYALGAVVVLCAVVGDSIGYEVGRRAGPRLLRTSLARRREAGIARARERLRTKGAVTVVTGRFTALLRAITPALCGLSRMPYRRFLLWNAVGGLVWGVAVTAAGYAAGRSLPLVEHSLGAVGAVLLAAFAVALLVARHRGSTQDAHPLPTGEQRGAASSGVTH